ncbi:MAG: CopD family protein [Cyclobacteriaceae bacterium]|nr:CopD family protein [Cyclobacteriaceae bacterium]
MAIMSRRLWYIITWPSAIITLGMGVMLLVLQPAWLSMPFMYLKIGFVVCLYLYHVSLHYIFGLLQNGVARYSSTQLRIWNEVSTVILIAVVFLIVKKDQLSWIWGTLGILGVAIGLMIAIRLYKKFREKK